MIASGTNEPTTSVARRRSNPRAAWATSSRSPTRSAAAVPACSAISNALRSSGSRSGYDQPSSHGTSVVWADEETGMSSAGPWSTPSAIACESFRLASGRRRIRRGLGRALAPAAHDQQRDPEDDQRDDRIVDVVQAALPLLPVRADLLADERQQEDPRQAAGDREGGEAPERHLRHPGRERDERADDRQHSREEHGRVAVAGEPAVGPLQVRRLDVQLGAVLLEDVDPAEVADRV